MAIGLVIIAYFVKKLRITRTAMIITSITLLVILFLFNSNSNILSDSSSKIFDTHTISVNTNSVLSNIKESISKLSYRLSSGMSVPNEDSLSAKCKKSYDNCKDIFTQKYGVSVTLIKMEEFEDGSKAREFYDTWNEITWEDSILFGDVNPPVVLFAIAVRNPNTQVPGVLVCDTRGDLIEKSKREMYCK